MESRLSRLLPWLLLGGAALLGLASVVQADRAGAAGAPLLDGLAPLVEAWLRAGGALVDGVGGRLFALRLGVLAVLGAWLGARAWRRRPPGARERMLAALVLGWAAQSHLLDGYVAIGIALYALAVAVYLWRRPAPAAWTERLPALVELAAALSLLGLFTLVCLHRLDVQPELYYDEMAYLRAARMTAGEIPPGPLGRAFGSHLYLLERFQVQVVPHALHVASVSLLAPGILPIRLVSLLSGVLALVVMHLTLRRRLGPRSALIALGLACAAPVLVAYSRAGLYQAVSIPHGALCLACGIQLWERWSRRWAVLLGALLGSSLYLYQLSWFAPVLAAGGALALLPELRRRPRAASMAVATAASTVLVLLPALLLPSAGFQQVKAQTFGRGIFQERDAERPETGVALLLAPRPLDEPSLERVRKRLRELGLSASLGTSPRGTPGITLRGPAESVRTAVEALKGDSWLPRFGIGKSRWGHSLQMLAQLFYARGWESFARLVDAPLLNPLLSPLLVLGIAEALRRRREPLMRLLLVWIVGAALAPAALGNALPRRTLLMFPFAAALMVLPLRELTRGFRGAGAVAAALIVLGANATGHHLYFERWGAQLGAVTFFGTGTDPDRRPRAPMLELARLVRSLPADEPILMPRLDRRIRDLFALLEERPAGGRGGEGRIHVTRKVTSERDVRLSSCRVPPPFYWIFRDEPEQRRLFEVVERSFQVEAQTRGAFRVLRATAAKGRTCSGRRPRGG